METSESSSGSRGSGFALTLVEGAFKHCPPYVGWRVLAAALRAAGLRLGKASVFWGVPTFSGGADVCNRLSIGAHCGFNLGCHFEVDDDVTIEDHVSVGHQVTFLTRQPRGNGAAHAAATAPVHIGAGAWLGSRCVVMPGVTIGAGAVIGAASVVVENVPPNVLYSGGRKVSLAKWR